MTGLSFLQLLCFLAYIGLSVFIILKNPKSLLNKLCTAVLLCYAIWTFGFIFIHNPHLSEEIVLLFGKIQSFGWMFLASFVLWFFLVLTEKKKIIRSKLFIFLLFLPPLMFLHHYWTQNLISGYSKQAYGWQSIYADTVWVILFFLYFFLFIITGLIILLQYWRKTEDLIRKKQVAVILLASVITLLPSAVTNVILPLARIYSFPDLANMIALIWGSGMIYALLKFKLFHITPATASENIIATMNDSLLLVDPHDHIIMINKASEKLLGYSQMELQDKHISTLFPKTEQNDDLEEILHRKSLISRDSVVLTKKGNQVPVSLSSSILKDNSGIFGGFALVLRDTTEKKQAEKNLTRQRMHLEESFERRTEQLREANRRLKKEIEEKERAEKIKDVLFNISQATSSSENLKDLLTTIHAEVGKLFDTKNFYVVLYDQETNLYSFPFYVDETEQEVPSTPLEMKKSLTDYVRRKGKAQLVDMKEDNRLIRKGEVAMVGEPAAVWMGAPLMVQSKSIGVVAAQNYHDENAYNENDLQLLSFISDHIALAIQRKQNEDMRLRSLKEKEVLLKEIHHRVKNNLQIISSLIRLQITPELGENALELFSALQDRIRTMATIHETLYQAEDISKVNFSEYVDKMISYISTAYQSDSKSISFHQDVKDINLDINRAIPCGLIINELVSNSIKHAFPDNRSGSISLKMRHNKKDQYHLEIKDTGVGLPEDFNISEIDSLGMLLISDLVRQIDGKIEITSKKGTQVSIIF